MASEKEKKKGISIQPKSHTYGAAEDVKKHQQQQHQQNTEK